MSETAAFSTFSPALRKSALAIRCTPRDLTPFFYCKAGSRYKIKSAGVDLIALDFDLTQEHNSEKTPFSPIRITKDTKLPPCNNTFIDDCDYLNGHLFLPDGMKYDSLLSQIPKEFASRKPLYRENCSALLKTVLVEFIRDCAGATTQTANAVQKIIAYVETNYQQALSNALFSEMTGYHEHHLNRLFVKHTGFTLHRYILNVRMAQAKKLLLGTDLPLSLVAEKAGFNSSTHFSSYFKQITGMSPLAFRSRFKNSI